MWSLPVLGRFVMFPDRMKTAFIVGQHLFCKSLFIAHEHVSVDTGVGPFN